MRVDHPWEHGGLAKVNHPGIGRNRDSGGWADIGYPVAFDQDDLVGQHLTRFGVEQTTSSNGDYLILRPE